MTSQLFRTQFFPVYGQIATLTEFAGFEMPLYFRGIIPEHLAVRNSVGIFDISHMGRAIISGTDAERFLNYVITNDVSKLTPCGAQYSVMCTETGGIIDDFIVYRMEPERFLMVFNAGNRSKDYNWLAKNSQDFGVKIEVVSENVAMLAVQGPNALQLVQEISAEDLSKIERFKCIASRLADTDAYLARTGYTGEDGFEIFVWNASLQKPENALRVWNALLETGKTFGIELCGLGARDTLRLEAGLCLYGNDIDERSTPFEAGLGFVVKLQKDKFIGKEALQKQKTEGIKRKRVGLVMTEQGIPRQGMEILNDKNEKIGNLTSGTFSPVLKRGVGMGYVEIGQASESSTVFVGIRERKVKARLSIFPLYDPNQFGARRKTAA